MRFQIQEKRFGWYFAVIPAGDQHFLPPDTHPYVCIIEREKCYFFGPLCVHTK